MEKCMEKCSFKNSLKQFLHRYFIQGLNGMALGLFCTLIIGLMLKQVAQILPAGTAATFVLQTATLAMTMTGPVIGIGVAHALQAPRLIILSSGVTGMIGAFGYVFGNASLLTEVGGLAAKGPGDPLGAFFAVVIGVACGRLVSQRTKIDIIVTPMVTILSGSLVAYLIGEFLYSSMQRLGQLIQLATELQPFLMGMVLAVLMGVILTLPISSAALSIILGLSGLAAGAATVGCSAQMIGFAVISYRENGMNGLLAQGLGTSMLQVPNLMKKPLLWIPPIFASAILGPVATVLLKMENNPAGAGMGTSGLVGQLMTWQTMAGQRSSWILFVQILLMHFVFPALLAWLCATFMRKKAWIKDGDYQLNL